MKHMIFVAFVLFSAVLEAQSLSILQGATDSGSAQINVLVPKGASFTYALSKGNMTIAPATVLRYERAHSEWSTETVYFKYLDANTGYEFSVTDHRGDSVDLRKLSTLPASKKSVKYAFASCMNHKRSEQTAMWDSVLNEKPDILFLTGDNNYSAHNIPLTPEQMWDGYVTSRLALRLYRLKTLIPSLATWDDHDFGVDNGNSTYAYVKESQATFEAFYGQTEQSHFITKGPGVSRVAELFGQRFFMLDGRSFQSPKGSPVETFFGKDQEEWLERELLRSDIPVWMINGTVLFGKNQLGESIEKSHKKSFTKFTSLLKESRAPMFFVSGDIHYSMVQDLRSVLGFRAYELTSSAIHSTPNPVYWLSNDRRLKATNALNFLTAEVSLFNPGMRVNVVSVKAKNKREFTLTDLIVTSH